MRFLPGVLAFLLVASCNRSETPAAEPPLRERPGTQAPSETSRPDSRPVIVAFGDSLSAGFGAPAGASYPDFLQRELDRRGYGYRVVNAGISGDTTSGGLARLDSVLALKPEIVILELGGNDGLRGLPLAVTRDNIEKMVTGLKRAGATVVLAGMTLPPNYGPEYIPKFEQIYRELAKKHDVTLIPFLLEGVAGTPLMQRDGLHPTLEGNRKVAQIVVEVIEPLLKNAGRGPD